jgi:NAD(P)H-dependent flavin oxidoreductase YrpB (nitropropane dioxygenase family)
MTASPTAEPIRQPPPRIIQGGMGVAISSWQLARAVSATGNLGVVSGTALDVVYARRLQDGDEGGHVRRALAAFPVPAVAQRVLDTYFLPAGRPARQPYAMVPMFTLQPPVALQELTVVANFCEVYLAKEGHHGAVGINYLRKIELPIPFACLGAMLAGIDYVLMGAGNPADLPEIIRRLARRDGVALSVRTQGTTSADGTFAVRCSPRALLGAGPPLNRPQMLAIIASTDLAAGLAGDPVTRPDGFIIEGHSAGGHNAPPRGPRRMTPTGEPVYDDRDAVDLDAIRELGLPFWLAGSQGSPDGLRAALTAGAAGVQVGTVFAFCAESGLADKLKRQVLRDLVSDGDPVVRADWRLSPTGFPFKVLDLAGTLSDPDITARPHVCDIGALRSPYRQADGTIGYRCPAEPTKMYLSKGGRVANTEGRHCLCNALLAAADLPQRRPHGYDEPAVVTSGDDLSTVAALIRSRPDARPYPASAVIDYLCSVPVQNAP